MELILEPRPMVDVDIPGMLTPSCSAVSYDTLSRAIKVFIPGRFSGLDAPSAELLSVEFGHYTPHDPMGWRRATARYRYTHDWRKKAAFDGALRKHPPVPPVAKFFAMRCPSCRDWLLEDVLVTDDANPQCPSCFAEGWVSVFPVMVPTLPAPDT